MVDNFGVCNGYDASGIFQVALAEGSSTTATAAALGLASSGLTSASECVSLPSLLLTVAFSSISFEVFVVFPFHF